MDIDYKFHILNDLCDINKKRGNLFFFNSIYNFK